MKKRIIFVCCFLLIFCVGFYIVSSFAQNTSADLSNSLKVNIKSSKSAYIQGEIVSLDVELKNESSSDIFLHGADVQSGYLKILISASEGNFKEYKNTAWGNSKSKPKVFKVGQVITSQATILSNVKSNTMSNGSESKELMTDYAFPEAGVYYLKVVLIVPYENSIRIESKPIQLVVNEPVGEDLEVWNKIKNRSDIAYFMQEGEFYARNSEETEKFIQAIENITTEFPNSLLANQMKRSIEKFQTSEERRKEFRQKTQNNQEKKP